MNKKTTSAVVTGIIAGITIYLITKMIKEKNATERNNKLRSKRPKRIYAYEYSL